LKRFTEERALIGLNQPFWVKLDDLSVWANIDEEQLGEYFLINEAEDLWRNFEVKQIIKIREAIRGCPDPIAETRTKKTLCQLTIIDWVNTRRLASNLPPIK
jgi:hypothetical protein